MAGPPQTFDFSNPVPGFFKDGREESLRQHILERADTDKLRNNPAAVIAAITAYTRTHRMMIFHEPKIDACREQLARMHPPPNVLVECGTYVGNSAVAWGAMLKELNPGQEVKVFTFEMDPDFVQIAKDLIEVAGLADVVTVMQGRSGDSLAKLKQDGVGPVDVLFLDHWEAAYVPDLQKCEELGLFRKGTLILADNTDIPGAPDYLEYVKAGGSGEAGSVKYISQSMKTKTAKGPNIVEVTKVVEI